MLALDKSIKCLFTQQIAVLLSFKRVVLRTHAHGSCRNVVTKLCKSAISCILEHLAWQNVFGVISCYPFYKQILPLWKKNQRPVSMCSFLSVRAWKYPRLQALVSETSAFCLAFSHSIKEIQRGSEEKERLSLYRLRWLTQKQDILFCKEGRESDKNLLHLSCPTLFCQINNVTISIFQYYLHFVTH